LCWVGDVVDFDGVIVEEGFVVVSCCEGFVGGWVVYVFCYYFVVVGDVYVFGDGCYVDGVGG